MPTLNLSAVDYAMIVNKTHKVVELDNNYLHVVIFPEMGRVYSIFYKPTGHEVLWRNDIAWPGGANNKLGWWLWMGGIEYTLPGEEHGYTWALNWNWSAAEGLDEHTHQRVATVWASIVEPSTGLHERLTFSLLEDAAALQTDVEVINPVDNHATTFAHWTNVPFVPGGTNELRDDTTFEVPTKAIKIEPRWQHNLGPSPQTWPASKLHTISGWTGGMGDFTSDGLFQGFFGVYSPSADEGAVRTFDVHVTPGLDTWTYGYHPAPNPRPLPEASKGYAEMWGGNVRALGERSPIAAGARIAWSEYIRPYHGLGGPRLDFADELLAARLVCAAARAPTSTVSAPPPSSSGFEERQTVRWTLHLSASRPLAAVHVQLRAAGRLLAEHTLTTLRPARATAHTFTMPAETFSVPAETFSVPAETFSVPAETFSVPAEGQLDVVFQPILPRSAPPATQTDGAAKLAPRRISLNLTASPCTAAAAAASAAAAEAGPLPTSSTAKEPSTPPDSPRRPSTRRPTTPPPARPRVDPSTGRFLLADGRTADFRGACVTQSSGEQHVGGLVHLRDEKLGWFASLGLNTMRVGVHWSLYEPRRREYNASYLAEIVQLVGRMAAHGLWAILDMHQDQWSEYYCAGHGVPPFYAQPPDAAEYAAGGERAYPQPIAASTFANASVPMDAQMDCTAFMRAHHGSAASLYTYALGAASQRLYDEPQLQAAFGVFWADVARAVRPLSNVLALELINEPWYGDVQLARGPLGVDGWQLAQPANLSAPSLMRLHAALHASIRAVDDETILLFEPGAGGAAYLEPTGFTEGPGGAGYSDRQAFAYHQYCPGSLDAHEWGHAPPPASAHAAVQQMAKCNASTSAMVQMRAQDAVLAGSGGAALVTEFGQVNNDTIGVADLVAATEAFERMGHGWTIWSVQLMNYLQTGGVPGYGVKPMPPPTNWLRPLVRTFASAVAGRVLAQRFDPHTGDYELRFAAADDGRVRALPTTIHFAPTVHYAGGFEVEVIPRAAGHLVQKGAAADGDTAKPPTMVFEPSDTLAAGELVVLRMRQRA